MNKNSVFVYSTKPKRKRLHKKIDSAVASVSKLKSVPDKQNNKKNGI